MAAAAIGAGFGIAAITVNDAYVARDFGWLRPITSFSKAVAATIKPVGKRALTPNEIVAQFREEGLPVAIIADVCSVERKTVYAWLAGGLIRPHNQERLEQLYALLSKDKLAEMRDLYRFWNRSLIDGSSLGLLLKQPVLDGSAIEAALGQLWPLAQKQQEFASKNVSSGNIKSNPFLRESREVGLSNDV